jgi:DNA-binding NtrC family response regulator
VLSFRGARLIVTKGPDRGRERKVDREEIVVGTAPSAELLLTDPTVSRNHLTLRVVEDGYLVVDLESTNGTMLRGRRVERAYAEPGDNLDLGATRIKLEPLRDRVDLPLSESERLGTLIGRSVSMRRLFALLEQVAPEDITVLLTGESGSGKDAVAEVIHAQSGRAKGPFVVVDCGSLVPALAESELFGHERGAFTGASARREGAFEEAHGGTVFLDEIGELPLDLQPRLLRVLEKREIRRVGGVSPIELDVRILAATHRDLKRAVNRGLFREDLYYRLSVVTIAVPPLRERREDIPLLAEHFRRQISGDLDGTLPSAVVDQFLAHSWPGNVRELRNSVERALVAPEHAFADAPAASRQPAGYHVAKAAALDAFEKEFLTALVQRARGNLSEAARLGQMDRVHLYRLLRKHGVGRR